MAGLTNRSHRVNLRSLLGPCFEVVVYNETWGPMLNLHLSYKPPSSWRILFCPGWFPKQFIRLNFSGPWWSPAGAAVRGYIIQGRQLKRRFSCGRPIMPEKKSECNRSVCMSTWTDAPGTSPFLLRHDWPTTGKPAL